MKPTENSPHSIG